MNLELAGILLSVIIQGLYVAFKLGKLEQKIENLEDKQSKHNNLIERMVRVEDKAASAHKRIDDLI